MKCKVVAIELKKYFRKIERELHFLKLATPTANFKIHSFKIAEKKNPVREKHRKKYKTYHNSHTH